MSLLTGLFLVVGALIGGGTGMVIAFLFAAGMNLFAYWNSDKVLLSMYGARQVDAASAPDLVHIVRAAGGAGRICRCRRSSSPKIRSPMPSPPGAVPNMPRSASPAGLLATRQQ